MLDESPTLSTKATLIVDPLRSKDETPSRCSLDLAELKYESTAEVVNACLLSCSLMHDFFYGIFATSWIGFTTDWCLTMLEINNVLLTVVTANYPDIISRHCSLHRLELAVNDSLSAVTNTNHFSIFFPQ